MNVKSKKQLEQVDFLNAINELGIGGADVCVHASVKSFGAKINCGIKGIVLAFLSQDCTVMVPAFCDEYEARPEKKYMPERNGAGDYSFFLNRDYPVKKIFDVTSREISLEEMGLFSKTVLDFENAVRGNNPLNSFAAVGRNAEKLTLSQTARDVYAPLRRLCDDGGYVLLIGVGLDSATIIHYAEQLAGRTPFVRWAYGKDLRVIPVSAGSCSDGFENLAPFVSPIARKTKVAESEWICFKASDLAALCQTQITRTPKITHCPDPTCPRCNDAISGGPILPPDFWK
ncbi:AAC(3) family N-acetyltransferase [Treponema sp.]|uniref:AAC(3) family N-acetyltransferase n=1 Tax=Treponema sp. TaxID=166 RepID=UPI003EFE78C0